MTMGTAAMAALTAALLAIGVSGCSGDDGEKDDATGSAAPVSFAGPDEPETVPGACPLTAKQVSRWVGEKVRGTNCSYEAVDSAPRVSIVPAAASDTDAFDTDRKDLKGSWDEYAEVSGVPGEAFAVWSDDELNTIVRYRDNASAYTITLSALTPDQAGADDVPGLAQDVIELIVKKRPKV